MELIKGTYVGPLSAWKGKTAMLEPGFYAQFDDLKQYTSIGWHPFRATDWSVTPPKVKKPVYQRLAECVSALHMARGSKNLEWAIKWAVAVEQLVKEHLPSGSGFDNGVTMDVDSSNAHTLVFDTSFHHMDENGSYTGWTEHKVHITPNLASQFDIRVTGSNKNGIRDYISETFSYALSEEVENVTF